MEWKISTSPVSYPDALAFMEQRVADIRDRVADECVWLLEHPPLYTGGTSAKGADLLSNNDFPVYETGRGGQYTYHGPGQRIAYVMLDLKRRAKAQGNAPDLRAYVKQLEAWLIATLAAFDVAAFTREGRVGVWVDQESEVRGQGSGSNIHARENPAHSSALPSIAQSALGSSRRPVGRSGSNQRNEAKIAALGIRVRKWVSFHGISLNVHPDLSHYSGIIPCGISEFGVTSLEKMAVEASMGAVDAVLKKEFEKLFGE